MIKLRHSYVSGSIGFLLIVSMVWGYCRNLKTEEKYTVKINEAEIKYNVQKELTKKFEDSTRVLSQRLYYSLQRNVQLNQQINRSNENWKRKYFKQVTVDSKRDTVMFSDTKYLLSKHRQSALERNK